MLFLHFLEDAGGFFAKAFDKALGWVGAEDVEEGHGEGQGSGVDGGEFDGHEETGDHVRVELFRFAFGSCHADVPGDVVLGDLQLRVRVAVFLLNICKTLLDDWESVSASPPVVVVVGDGHQVANDWVQESRDERHQGSDSNNIDGECIVVFQEVFVAAEWQADEHAV